MKRLNVFKIRKFTVLLLGIIVAVIALQSCQQDEEATMEASQAEEVELIENTTTAEDASDQEVELADLAELQLSSSQRTHQINCFTTSWDSTANVLTVDFGSGCIGPFGRERSGKIIVTYQNEGRLYISDRVITFEDYVVNNRAITGEIRVVRAERNENQNLQNTYTLVNYTITFPDGNDFVVNGSRTREWIEGEGDGDITTNRFSITGSLSGVSTRGRSWSHTIIEPIIADFGCLANGNMLRSAGVKEIVHRIATRERIRTVDYGDGECDNTYTVTINDNVIEIEG